MDFFRHLQSRFDNTILKFIASKHCCITTDTERMRIMFETKCFNISIFEKNFDAMLALRALLLLFLRGSQDCTPCTLFQIHLNQQTAFGHAAVAPFL